MQKPICGLGQNQMLQLPSGQDQLVGLYRVCREWDAGLSACTVHGAVRSATLSRLDQDTGELRCQILGIAPDLVDYSGNISPQGECSRIRVCAVSSGAKGQGSAGDPLAAPIYVSEVLLQELRGKPQVRERDTEMGLSHWTTI